MFASFRFRAFLVLFVFVFIGLLLGSIGCTLNTSGKSSFLDRATSLTGTKTTTSNTSLKGKVIDALDEKGL
ncbi:hypothetical protein KAJ27_24980, partial [bacterium]|nr:hypothetical protein [bacterium]